MTGLSFILGTLAGVSAALFITGATRTSKENEIYMEGYNAGKADKLEYEISVIKARAKESWEHRKENLELGCRVVAFGLRGKAEAFEECAELLEGKK